MAREVQAHTRFGEFLVDSHVRACLPGQCPPAPPTLIERQVTHQKSRHFALLAPQLLQNQHFQEILNFLHLPD
jgi:hypothetical protein